jgi:hypothetical protein
MRFCASSGSPQAGEQLERTGFDDDRPVPAERLRATIDQLKWDAAAGELDGENQPARTGADDQNGAFRHGR